VEKALRRGGASFHVDVLRCAAADAVFARIAGDLFDWNLDLGTLPARIVVVLVVGWLSAGLFTFVASGGDGQTTPGEADRGKLRLGSGEATTLNNMGALQSRPDSALGYFTRALALLQQTGDRTGEARTLSNLGVVLRQQGRSAVLRRLAAAYLERRREKAIDDQYRQGYADGEGLGPEFEGWEEEAVWPEG